MPAANEPSPSPVSVQHTGGVPPRLFVAMVVVAIAVCVALLKPWGSAPADHGTGGLIGFALPPSAVPTEDPAAAIARRALCDRPETWRLITMETSVLGDTRTMYGIEPAPAGGPTDMSIPTAHLYANLLFAIGACQPGSGDASPGPSLLSGVTIWKVTSAGDASRVDMPVDLDPALYERGEAYLGPPNAEADPMLAVHTRGTWEPGRYVLQIANGSGGGQELWMALDFLVPITHTK